MPQTALSGGLRAGSRTKDVSGSADVYLLGDQACYQSLIFTGTLTADIRVIPPISAGDAEQVGLTWAVTNSTSGGFSITFIGPTGGGVILAPGETKSIRYDGSTMQDDTEPVGISDALDLMGARAPGLVTVIGGQTDDAMSTVSGTGASYAADTVNFKLGTQGHKLTTGTVTATMRRDPLPNGDPWNVYEGKARAQAVFAWIYCEDTTAFSSLSLELWLNSAGSITWSRNAVAVPTPGTALANGWNYLRWPTVDGVSAANLPLFGSFHACRLVVGATAAKFVTVGHVGLEMAEKARVVVEIDRGYQSFFDQGGYADLVRHKIPMTIASDPALLGTGSGATAVISRAYFRSLARENRNEIGIHGWDGAATSAMTADQLIADHWKAVKELQAMGIVAPPYRHAYPNNLALAASVNALTGTTHPRNLVACSTYASGAATTCFPWPRFDNVPRLSIHGRAFSEIDSLFLSLKLTHGVARFYTHGINQAAGNDSTPAEWAYFVGKMREGMEEGWLEPTTWAELYARGGAKYRRMGGDVVYEYFDELGAVQRTRCF